MRLLIDGCECPLVGDRGTIPGRDLRCMESVEAWREGRSMELWVELTPAMERLFAHAEELHRSEAFNDAYHHGEVMVDGVVLFSGVVGLLDDSETTAIIAVAVLIIGLIIGFVIIFIAMVLNELNFKKPKMLSEKEVYSDIVAKTGASTATISRVNRSLQYGQDGYDIVFGRMQNNE